MGLVRVTAEIGKNREMAVPVRFLVDTGSLYTCVRPEMAEELELELPLFANTVTANVGRTEAPLGMAFIRVGNRDGGTLVATMEVPEPLLGAVALQALGIKVNPEEETIEFTGHYPPKA